MRNGRGVREVFPNPAGKFWQSDRELLANEEANLSLMVALELLFAPLSTSAAEDTRYRESV